MPIEFTLPDVDCSADWRNLPHEMRMVHIATMAKFWAKVLG